MCEKLILIEKICVISTWILLPLIIASAIYSRIMKQYKMFILLIIIMMTQLLTLLYHYLLK